MVVIGMVGTVGISSSSLTSSRSVSLSTLNVQECTVGSFVKCMKLVLMKNVSESCETFSIDFHPSRHVTLYTYPDTFYDGNNRETLQKIKSALLSGPTLMKNRFFIPAQQLFIRNQNPIIPEILFSPIFATLIKFNHELVHKSFEFPLILDFSLFLNKISLILSM